MKNLQNKTTLVIIVIATLLVSGQLVFGVELKKKDLWENNIGYGTFELIPHSDMVKEKVLDSSYKLNTEYYPIKYGDYTVYGYYGSIQIGVFKNSKLRKAFMEYQSKGGKANRTVDEACNNNIIFMGNGYYDPLRGYIYDFMVENWFGYIDGFEDMVIGFVDTKNNQYISGSPIKTTYKPVIEGYSSEYNGSNYCSQFILTIPKDFENWDSLALYISNNYIPGNYYSIGQVIGKDLKILKSSYDAYIETAENNKQILASYELEKKSYKKLTPNYKEKRY